MLKRGILIILSLVILVMSWEGSLEAKGIIPDDSIRIRILANSDSVSDQWIKRQVRNAIIAETESWISELYGNDIHSARQLIIAHLSDIERIANETLLRYGFHYGATVELGKVPFPEKQFGNRRYAESEYEALRITLGEGKGENWWCVLFPPLCFIDGTTAPIYPQGHVDKKSIHENNSQSTENAVDNAEQTSKKQGNKENTKGKVKAKFFIVELWQQWF